MTTRKEKVRHAFSSWSAFDRAIQVKQSDYTKGRDSPSQLGFQWSNEHLDPTPPSERTWNWLAFCAFWLSYGFSTGVWNIGSSMLSAGLRWYQAIIVVFIAHLLGGIGIALNSRAAATYHIGFPVATRASFGMVGSFFPVLLRCAVGIVWVGVQLTQGGYFLSVALRCIFGYKWAGLNNTIPTSAGITTKNLIACLLFCLFTLPGLFVRIHKIRFFYFVKAIIMPFAAFGLLIFCLIHGRQGVAQFPSSQNLQGTALAWTMVRLVNTAMGKTTPSMVAAQDIARYSKTRVSPLWSQLLMLPIANTAVALVGMLATSSASYAWGKTTWNPWDLCTLILDNYWNAGSRFAILLVSLSFCLSIFASNQAANVVPFGADIAALMPRYLNINRGQMLSYALGLLIQPWYILASASTFLTFLGGYSIFIGPVTAIAIVDYFLVRRGNIDVKSLYDPKGVYHYHKGWHWRAYVTFIVGIALPLPGFIGAFPAMAGRVPIGAQRLYYVGWILGVVLSATVYYALSFIHRPESIKAAAATPFEEWADEQRDLLDRTEQLPHVPKLRRNSATSSEAEDESKVMKTEVQAV